MAKVSEVLFFHYSNTFMNWVLNLPQLRHDILKLYKINVQDFEEDEENETKNESLNLDNLEKGLVKHSDYLDLLKYGLNLQLNKDYENMNIFKIIDKINFKIFVAGARFFLF